MRRTLRRLSRLLMPVLAILLAVLVLKLALRYRDARREQEAADARAEAGIITEHQAYSALTYNNGSATLSFALDEEGNWIWADDPDFPLDDATVTAVTDLLTSLKPQQIITEPEALESYGLDSPTATLTATGDTAGDLTLALGKTTTDGNSYYMQMNGDDTKVYIIADTLYQYMAKPIYGMMRLPELPALRPDLLRSVTIQGYAYTDDKRETTATTLTAQEDNGAVTWRSNGANVTDSETVQALLEDLSALAFDRCVDYRPSDEAAALCGFSKPAALLKIAYTTESGTDQTLTLTIGTPLPDGSGRFVRMDSDTTIYLLPTAALDPLMRVSVSGLE